MRRRDFLAAAFAAGASSLGLGGCDGMGGAPDDRVTLRFWNMFSGPDGRTMLGLVRKFNAQSPDMTVVMQRMHWSTYYNKLFVAGLGGRAPEVFITHGYALRRFVGAGFVRKADDLFGSGKHQLDPADFDPNILQAMKQGGAYWGVPLDVHPLGMYYNRTLLKSVGFVDATGAARPPTNRDEFLDLLHRLKPRPGLNPRDTTWGFVYTWQRTNLFAIVKQFGGQLFNHDLTRATFDAPRNVAALAWASDLVRQGLVPGPQNFDSWIGFRQGRVGVVFEGIYVLPEVRRQADLDWGAAPLPMLGTQRATWGESHSLVMRNDLEGHRLDAAKRFIKFLSDHSLDWAEGGQVPVRQSLRDSERFAAMYAQNQFAKQIPYVTYLPPAPFVFEYLRAFDDAIELALRGTKSARAALSAADSIVQPVIERYARQDFWDQYPTGGGK
ncbi:MAG TPA: ABC transporter substrate-binding protein [Tepidisphaeraceae bacterium]|nr:ABC transporter substrate-binding protein [Tepidisphaeraceae bacterium]